MMTKSILALIVMVALFVNACGPKPPATIGGRGESLTADERNQIITAAGQYLGIPYKSNGIDPRGFDCSGFIRYVFKQALNLELPRSAADIYDKSFRLKHGRGKPADLVFFSTDNDRRPDHIGLMIGGDKFIHASKSRGVIISSLDDQYYGQRLLGLRRLYLESPEVGSR